jgi:hypothetical protein
MSLAQTTSLYFMYGIAPLCEQCNMDELEYDSNIFSRVIAVKTVLVKRGRNLRISAIMRYAIEEKG